MDFICFKLMLLKIFLGYLFFGNNRLRIKTHTYTYIHTQCTKIYNHIHAHIFIHTALRSMEIYDSQYLFRNVSRKLVLGDVIYCSPIYIRGENKNPSYIQIL